MRATTAVLLFLLTLAPLFAQLADDEFPPEDYPKTRYTAMKQRSPFVLPSFSEQAVQPPAADWSSDFRIVNVLKRGAEVVVIARKISTNERTIIRRTPNPLGLRLVEIQMSNDPNEVSATVEMHNQSGTIRYDESILSQLPRSVAPNNPALQSE